MIRYFYIIVGLLFSSALDAYSQSLSELDYEILSHFLEQRVESRKDKSHDIKQFVIVNETDAQTSIDYLLNFSNRLREISKEDTEWLELLYELKKDTSAIEIKNNFQTKYNVNLVSREAIYSILLVDSKKWKWKRFYRKFPKSYGFIEFSKVVYNSQQNKLAFYYGIRKNNLSGAGFVILMHKINEEWSIAEWLEIWMS